MLKRVVLICALLGGGLWLWPAEDEGPPPRAEVEQDRSRESTAKVFGGPTRSITYRVILDRPEEPIAVEKMAKRILRAAPKNAIVGVRFVFSDYPRDLAEDIGQPYYAWRLYWPGREPIEIMTGISEEQARDQYRSFVLQPGEKLEQTWVDYYSTIGLVATTLINSDRYFLHMAMPESRYRLQPRRDGPGPGTHLRATESIHISGPLAGQRFAANGIGVDTVSIALRPDGTLDVYGGRYKPDPKPWLKAKPFTP